MTQGQRDILKVQLMGFDTSCERKKWRMIHRFGALRTIKLKLPVNDKNKTQLNQVSGRSSGVQLGI